MMQSILFVGGLCYLYRKELGNFVLKHKVVVGVTMFFAIAAYFAIGASTLTILFFCFVSLVYTLGCNTGGYWSIRLPNSSVVSASSLPVHMVIYRVLEKLHLVHLFGNGLLAYIFTAVAVICGRLCLRYVPSGS